MESVIATIEVKSELTRAELEKAAKAARTSKLLVPNFVSSFQAGYIPPRVLNYVVAYDGPASMETVYGWIPQIHECLGIEVPNLPSEPGRRQETPSPSVDGVFVLQKGFLYFDNVPYGFISDATRRSRPDSKWVFSDTESGNLLLFFMFVQAATANIEGRWLNPVPYLQTFTLPNIGFGS